MIDNLHDPRLDFHQRRAREERDIADRATDPCVADAHMRLADLHIAESQKIAATREGTEPAVRDAVLKSLRAGQP